MAREMRDHTHARLVDVLGPMFKRLLSRLPSQVPGGLRLTPDQYGLLALVAASDGCSMGEIAAGRGIALNSATALVERLVALGTVERATDPSDRRVVRVVATEVGIETVERLRELRREALRRMLDNLDEADLAAIEKALPALDKLGRAAPIAVR